jgi:hypothetical protein
MRHVTTNIDEQLVNALHILGVNFIMGGNETGKSLHTHPSRLIAGLAQSDEARLRLSLIPLFLEHPEYAVHVRAVAKKLDLAARLTLQCYYSAAIWLAKKYQLNTVLPDYFSKDLGTELTDNPDENLRALAVRHKELSNSAVNWLATYQHAGQVWQKGLEYHHG